MRNVETLQQADETTVEYTWQGKTVEISMNNWILTEQGFFLWEDLDEKVSDGLGNLSFDRAHRPGLIVGGCHGLDPKPGQ